MWQKVAKFKGAEYFRKALYVYTAWLIIISVSMHHLSLCLPRLVASKDAETAGALMTFFLGLGLSIGAGFSFLLRLLV